MYLVTVYVRFTAEEAGRPANETDSTSQFPIRLFATDQEAIDFCQDKVNCLEEVRKCYGFYYGKLGHLLITKFVDTKPIIMWQPQRTKMTDKCHYCDNKATKTLVWLKDKRGNPAEIKLPWCGCDLMVALRRFWANPYQVVEGDDYKVEV
jgi:hypothetical protein